MSENLKQRAALSPERRALLELLLKEKRGNATSRQRITRVAAKDFYPLSFEQERLWFLHLLEPNSLMHNLNRISTLEGPLDVHALQQSFDEMVRRHEILRTTFRLADGRPIQVVQPAQTGMLPFTDLLAVPPEQREARAEELAAAQARMPFDLAQGPLLRAMLLRLGDEKHALLLTLHHVITDWWSFGVLYRELLTLYQAFASGANSPLPELRIQYGDYACWQREWLQDKELETLLSYWKQQLANCPHLLNLPTDRSRPNKQTFQGRRFRFAFPKELYGSLEELSHAEDVTTFMAALAVFQVLLYRYTAQEQILVGTPSANRSKLETEGLIGFLLNTLVLRGDLSGDPTFRELLRRLRGTVMGAYAHQDLPFQKLVEELKTERNLSVMPLVQVCFIFLSTQSPNLDAAIPQLSLPELPGLNVQWSNVTTIASEFDLTLSLENRPDCLDGFFEYNTELFEESTIARMVGHLRTLLEAVGANPDQRISELSLLTEEEEHGLRNVRSDSATAVAVKPFPQMFELQVARSPDATALTFGDESVSYFELNERANKLAHYLMSIGVGPEVVVGIRLERSVEMVVGLLAILKAGGVYLPLDPSYPAERLALMLDDSKARYVLTKEEPAAEAIEQQSTANPTSLLAPDNLAYVIYTSGSTGRPKGVQITHSALATFLNAMLEQPGLTSDDVLLAVTTTSFDISTLELFLPLITGARIVLADRDTARDGAQLLSLIERQGVTIMQATPSTWHLLLQAGWTSGGELKILTGGEALPQKVAAQLLERSSSLWNVYGPTETTVWSSVARLTSDQEHQLIGRPIAGEELYVLDRHLQPVPIGVAGEIYIGGAGLARGYAHAPELTAERFIPNPFRDPAGSRLYRTGDLGRRRADSTIEFLGRSDYQVKLRGHRIELGEIETVLREHAGVNECVVALRGEGGEAALVAYVVPAEEVGPRPDELRSYLAARLPRHMVPSAFVTLERLPLMVSGKVDRHALPAPSQSARSLTATSFVAPANELERTIAGIWSEVLGLEQVGTQDNFFDLGGHSLRLLGVQLKLRQTIGSEVPLFELFQYPTVSSLAAHLHQGTELESLDSSEQRGARRKESVSQRRLQRQAVREEVDQQVIIR